MPDFDVDGARKAGYSDDEILKHLTQTRKFDIDGARKAGYSNDEIITHLRSAAPAPAAKPSFGSRMFETGVGMAKGLGHTALGLADIGETVSGGKLLKKLLPDKEKANQEKSRAATEEFLKPETPSQEAGYGAEQLLEYVVPIAGEEKLLSSAPRALQTVARAGAAAVRTGLTAEAQTGDLKQALEAAAAAGTTSAAFSMLAKPIAALGRKIQASTIRPRLSDIKDGFKWETLDKFKLKGNLEQSLNQVDSELTRLRTARNGLIQPGSANVDIGKAFDEAMSEVSQKARDLSYGHMGSQAQKQLQNIRQDIEDLLGQQGPRMGPLGTPLVKPMSVDVSHAENLKEFLGTLGSWAYGRGDPEAKVSELVANTLYSKVKTAIEQGMGTQGPQVRNLNKAMQELIPVKHAMLARLPVEERNRLFSLADVAAMLPAVVTGDARMLALEGLTRAQKSLRFGNFLTRTQAVPKLGSVAARTAGAAVAQQ